MNVRDYFDSFRVGYFTEQINEVANQYGYINAQNYFTVRGTDQKAVIFDKNTNAITLLPQVARGDHSSTEGKERTVESFALPLAYFNHKDRLTAEDIQGWRQAGTPDMAETLARATAEKITDMRLAADQTNEYMKLQALKGIFKTPDGTTVANMFTEFNVVQKEVDFLLGTNTTDVDKKIAEVKRWIGANVKTGGAISGVEILVDPSFFDKLISHPNMKTAYQYYVNSGKQRLRDDMSSYMQWGIMDEFEHRGVRFVCYDATFNLPSGSTEAAVATDRGHAYALGVRDLFRGYAGPSNKISEANQPGMEMFLRTYPDSRDEYVDFQLEMAPLYFCTRPNSLVKILSSN